MMLRLLVLTGLATCSLALDPQLQVSSNTAGTTVTLNMWLFENDLVGTVEFLEIADDQNFVANDPNCQVTYNALPIDGRGARQWDVTVDISVPGAAVLSGAQANCPHINAVGAGTSFTIYVKYILNPANAYLERYYKIDYTGTDFSGRDLTGTFVDTPPTSAVPTRIAVTPSTYTATLDVTDAANTVITTGTIGDTIKLAFTLVVDPYADGLDFAGARVHSCQTAEDAGFTVNVVTIFGTDGCPSGGLTYNVAASSGFDRDDANSAIVNMEKTYIARTAEFELGTYTKPNPAPPNLIHFKCALSYCLDDTDTATLGQCGGQHCDPTRRKKRATEGDSEVVTSIRLQPRNDSTSEPEDNLCACPDDSLLYGSVGGLGAVAAILFGMMVFTYLDLQRSYRSYWAGNDRSASKSKESGTAIKSPQTKSTRTGSVVTSYYG